MSGAASPSTFSLAARARAYERGKSQWGRRERIEREDLELVVLLVHHDAAHGNQRATQNHASKSDGHHPDDRGGESDACRNKNCSTDDRSDSELLAETSFRPRR